MADRIYEELNNINIDEKDFSFTEDFLTDMERNQLKIRLRNRIFKKNRRSAKVAASIAIIAALSITFSAPVFAKIIGQYIPGIDILYERLGYYEEYKEFSEYLGVSKEEKGYKFTIDKLIADDNTVLIAMRISKSGMNEEKDGRNKDINFMMNSDLYGVRKGTIMGGAVDERVLDKDTSIVFLENKAEPNKTLPKRFNMRVSIHSTKNEEINVNFDLPVSREKIQGETKLIRNIGKSSIGNDIDIKLNELKASPISTTINYSFKGKLDSNQAIKFYIYDDKGRVYLEQSGMVNEKKDGQSTLNTVEKDGEKLYIIPYIQVKNGLEKGKASTYEKLDFYRKTFNLDTVKEFDFKEHGKVNVYKIEKNNNSIKIFYKLIGVDNTLNKDRIIQIYENNREDKEENEWIPTKYMKLYKPDKNERNNYCAELRDIDMNKNYVYSVGSYPIYKTIEGDPVIIDLNK